MTETLAFILILVLDLAAAAVVVVAANKWLKGWVMGLVAGIVVEIVRILLAMAIMSAVHDFQGGATLVWLVNLRAYGIPILIALGLTVGSAASQQTGRTQTACPHCKSAIALNMAVVRARTARAEGGLSAEYKEPCPVCKTELTYDVNTGDVIQTAGAEGIAQSSSGTVVTHGMPTGSGT